MRDDIKNKYCRDNNIPLLRIPFWEKEENFNILIQEALRGQGLTHREVKVQISLNDYERFKQIMWENKIQFKEI